MCQLRAKRTIGWCSAKTWSQMILLDFRAYEFHASVMKILLTIIFLQSLNLIVFIWLSRSAWIRIVALRQQLNIYKIKVKKPRLRNRDRLFWSLL